MQKIVRIVLIFLLLINIVYVTSGVIHYPLSSVDAFGIWFLKAKAVYLTPGFPYDFLKNTNYLYSHPQYPLLFPFFVSLVYFVVGGVKEIYPLLFSPLIYVFILIFSYKSLKALRLSDNNALLFTYIYSMFSPLLAEGGRKLAGTADIYITFIYWVVVYIVLTKKLIRTNWGWVIVFLVMVASQIKLEGAFLSIIFLFLPVNTKKKIIWLVLSLIPSMVWFVLVKKLEIPSDIHFLSISLLEIPQRFGLVIIGLVKEMLNYRNWYVFWPLFFVAGFLQKSKFKIMNRVIIPIVIVLPILFMLVYIFSSLDAYSYISSSIDRIMLQLSPFIYLVFTDRVKTFLTYGKMGNEGDNIKSGDFPLMKTRTV